ncbi:MAG: four-carbon acid sugar kinase family protein, partial [Chloroflexi bacterium]|nr:four-carbon acid sugar kinase family protein [Chloroflexota bacterium]
MNDSSTPIVGIFADDLTGALDAAAPFAARGFRTLVSPSHEMPDGASKADVISLNLGSRHMAPAEIAVRTVKAVNALKQFGVTVLMNKVDSTLRGNPGVELVAALNAVEGDHAVLCSAYPQNGRTVVDGILLVNEIPVADTDVGQDQLSPLPSSNVSEIIISSLERSGIADKAHVRSTDGGGGVSDFRPVIITPDASSEDDLFSLASRLLNARAVALVAGSAGLSTAIADALVADRAVQKRSPNQFVSNGRKTLIVTASQRQIVDAQINALGGKVDLIQTELSVDEVLKGITNDSVNRLIELTQRDGVVVLKLGKLKL